MNENQEKQNPEQQNPEEESARSPGCGMIMIGWGLALLVLTMFFSGVLERQQNPNQLAISQDGKLTLQPNTSGHYVVNGYINGYAVTFLVDTGATTVAVPEQIAALAGLEGQGIITIGTAAGNTRAQRSRIHRLEVGDFVFSDLQAMIIPSDSAQVLLGMNALEKLQISQEDGALILQAEGI